jgi:hypothetical protein
LHAATGSLIPDGLRGHTRSIKPLEGEQRLAFTEITVLTKPPSLAKRRGVDAEIGNNRYRLLFSVWNTATQSYVTWQHMATPLVVRNSFHMLPIEEKVPHPRRCPVPASPALEPPIDIAPRSTPC